MVFHVFFFSQFNCAQISFMAIAQPKISFLQHIIRKKHPHGFSCSFLKANLGKPYLLGKSIHKGIACGL